MTRGEFDFSGYVRTSPFYDASNNKVIGKMKDEANGKAITEFVGLKPKMYSYITDEGKEARRAKGVQRAVVRNKLCHSAYLKELHDPAENTFINRRIQSVGCHLVTMAQSKRGLSAFDDKRHICADMMHTLTYGHRTITDRVIDDVERDGDLGEYSEEEDENDDTAAEYMSANEHTLEERKKCLFEEMMVKSSEEELAGEWD